VQSLPQHLPDLSLDWRLVTLANGLRLITIARPGTLTVAVRAYVRAGSRYDVEDSERPCLGLAHFTEHLLFKGTRRHSQRELFARVERLGGVLEAGTAKEYASFHTVTPVPGLAKALEVLAEVTAQPALGKNVFEQEKLVVQNEIRLAQDRQGVLFDLFARTLWREHPLRYPVLGTLEGLQDLDHERLRAFHRARYVADNMVLVVCGDIEHDPTHRLVAENFASLPRGPAPPPRPVHEPALSSRRDAHLNKDLHQVQLLVGVPTVSMVHEDRSALKVLERVLGMGGSARLYQRLREGARLVYSVRTVTAHYEDAGFFAVHAACDPQRATQVRQAILDEWRELRREQVSQRELHAAKSNYAGTLARRFETNLALAGILGVECLLHRVETLDEAVKRISAVRHGDVQRVAEKYLAPECAVTASIGRESSADPMP
jgi:predicted Zn-dependent peptidase